MSRSALVAIAVLAAEILPRPAHAQPAAPPPQEGAARPAASDLRAQVAAIRKELEQLRPAAAQVQTLSGSVQAISARVTALEQQIERVGRQSAASPEVVGSIDRLNGQAAEIQRELESLRAQVAAVEQPEAGGAPLGGVEHDRAFEWVTADGAYALEIGGFVQPRYESTVAEGGDGVDEATFRLRRGRLALSGHAGSEELTYKVQLEVAGSGAPALDYFVDYELSPALSVRAGQDKLYFTRVWWASDSSIDIFERPAAVDGLRYDRDIGLWVHGELLDGRLYYHLGMSNGAGPNQRNDNIDVATLVRVEAALLGARFNAFAGNLTRDPELRVMVGGGAVHDLAQLPDAIGGNTVGNRDVDGNGETDNVRVWSTSADAAMRWHGLELVVEGLWRQERWGTILDHSDNQAIAALVEPDSDGHRNYLAGYVHASYPILPEKLQVAARAGHSRLTLLGVGGRSIDEAPPGDRLVELTGQVRYFHGAGLSFGGSYTFFNHNTRNGPEQGADIEHLLIAQGQLNF